MSLRVDGSSSIGARLLIVGGNARERLRRKYLSLGSGELVAAGLFSGIGVLQIAPLLGGPGSALPLWFALGPLVVILLQAGVYWLCARNWVERSSMPPGLAATYKALRGLNPVLLLAALVALIIAWPDNSAVGFALLGVWGFGVIEYVNYFVVRLSYPPSKWLSRVRQWRTPRLVQDIQAAYGQCQVAGS
jgi:hypothetical protein